MEFEEEFVVTFAVEVFAEGSVASMVLAFVGRQHELLPREFVPHALALHEFVHHGLRWVLHELVPHGSGWVPLGSGWVPLEWALHGLGWVLHGLVLHALVPHGLLRYGLLCDPISPLVHVPFAVVVLFFAAWFLPFELEVECNALENLVGHAVVADAGLKAVSPADAGSAVRESAEERGH